MKVRIVRIGDSLGIRIPRALLEQAGLPDEVEVLVKDGAPIVRAAEGTRAGWADAFRQMAHRGDDAMLDDPPPSLSNWDEDEWEW